MSDDMHKELQNLVCFRLGRRAEDPEAGQVTLRELLIAAAILFLLVYALDAAAYQLAARVIVPVPGIE